MTDEPHHHNPEETRNAAATLASLPNPWSPPLLDTIRSALAERHERLVVIDDDPTGTQTVHDVPVLMSWTTELLRSVMESSPVFYLSTNSRALDRPTAVELAASLGTTLTATAKELGYNLVVASRSDSTLRGHYPAETDAIAEAMGGPFDATILVPFFAAGGRLTIDDTHFVRQGDDLVPAALTEFANDATFGFRNSWLPAWVAEKTAGRVQPDDVICVGLDLLRTGGPAEVARLLGDLPAGGDSVVVVNATEDRDLEVFVTGLLQAETQGRRFLYRTAASFVRVRAGIGERPLLTGREVCGSGPNGGLFVVGSHVDKTSRQLDRLLSRPDVTGVELDVEAILDPERTADTVAAAAVAVDRCLASGGHAALATSRTLVTAETPEASLRLSTEVSEAVCAAVRDLTVVPRFLIAKGGITSSTVATTGLGVEQAWVLGQLQPGVPVWRLGDETSMPGTAFVVYPGNVGDEDGLVDALIAMETS